ncbi:MAG: hypothetical protein P1U56_21590 [Saprospiraceae bacterium]|nr:hypothetical protein [Saprospiraceae bacterium]
MKKLSVLVLFLISINSVVAQNDVMKKDEGAWNTLSMVTYERSFDETFGMDVEKPILNPIVRTLEGKEIEVEGYIIPLTGKIEQSHFMLSRFPQSMCFFCGKAGPESAAQVFTKNGKKIPFTDKKVKVKGILRINVTDITNLLYTLEDGVIID